MLATQTEHNSYHALANLMSFIKTRGLIITMNSTMKLRAYYLLTLQGLDRTYNLKKSTWRLLNPLDRQIQLQTLRSVVEAGGLARKIFSSPPLKFSAPPLKQSLRKKIPPKTLFNLAPLDFFFLLRPWLRWYKMHNVASKS